MKKYKELSQIDRYEIAILKDKGYSMRKIAKELNRSPNTISKELQNNRTHGRYDSKKANAKSRLRKRMRKYQWRKINKDNDLKKYIIEKLQEGLNPDEISGLMRKNKEPFYASKTNIYEWLRTSSGQRYCRFLYSKRYEKKKRVKKTKRVMIPDRIPLTHRFLGATNRTRYGHWEVDAIVSPCGMRGYLSVVQERKTKFVKIFKCNSMSCTEHVKKHKKVLSDFKVLSMTFDNGIENKHHRKLGIPTFFCDPYSSWQKGGVENVNKMIRKYIPKNTDISKLPVEYIRWIEEKINNKPRKILQYKTAYEMASEHGIILDKVS